VQLLLVEWDLGRAFVGGAGEQRWSVLTFVTLQGNELRSGRHSSDAIEVHDGVAATSGKLGSGGWSVMGRQWQTTDARNLGEAPKQADPCEVRRYRRDACLCS